MGWIIILPPNFRPGVILQLNRPTGENYGLGRIGTDNFLFVSEFFHFEMNDFIRMFKHVINIFNLDE